MNGFRVAAGESAQIWSPRSGRQFEIQQPCLPCWERIWEQNSVKLM